MTRWTTGPRSNAPRVDKLDKQRYWHALPVGWEQLEYTTFLERRFAQVTRDGFARLWDDAAPAEVPDELAELIALGESQALEFESTGRNVRGEVLDKRWSTSSSRPSSQRRRRTATHRCRRSRKRSRAR